MVKTQPPYRLPLGGGSKNTKSREEKKAMASLNLYIKEIFGRQNIETTEMFHSNGKAKQPPESTCQLHQGKTRIALNVDSNNLKPDHSE